MVRSRACGAKAVSLSKVIDLRRAGLIRANTASITDMVSAAVFPVSLARSVTRDLRSWRTSTGRVRLQMMRQDIVMTANLTPRKCLGFKTPFQAILKELGKDRPRLLPPPLNLS